MTTSSNILTGNPGFVGSPSYPNEYAADVDIEVVYGPEGDTVGALVLTARFVEGTVAEQVIGSELTAHDIRQLRDWCDAMLAAHNEDTEES